MTGVCSTGKIEMVKTLGADQIIDYTKEDFTLNGQTYDVIFDTVGSSSFSRCRNSLNSGGIYLTTVPTLEMIPHLINPFKKVGKSIGFAATALQSAKKKIIDLEFINQAIEEGSYLPVIDRTYPLEELARAHIYVEEGHKTGDVVITIA